MKITLGLGFGRSLSGTRAAAFSPNDLPQLALWLDAADISTITHTGGAVSQWSDKSANHHHATQATGTNQPMMGIKVNGLNTLTADGGNDFMILPAGLHSIANGPNTFFLVLKNTKTTAQIAIYGVGANSNAYTINFGEGGSFTGRQYKHGGQVNYTRALDTTSVHTHAWVRDGLSLRVMEDGEILATGTNATGSPLSALYIMGTGTNRWSGGSWCELLIYNRALSNKEINDVGLYLGRKWGAVWTAL